MPEFDSQRQDMFGQYHMQFIDHVLYLRLQGACRPVLAEHIRTALIPIMQDHADTLWGCVIDLANFEALTEGAVEILKALYQLCINQGCIVDSYLSVNAVAKFQFNRIRHASGIRADINRCCFDSKSIADRYIHHAIKTVSRHKAFAHNA